MSFLESIASKIKEGIEDVFDGGENQESGSKPSEGVSASPGNRFHSFAPQRTANDAKWFVDGCGYMWAVSVALEEARESIWILDWWLSPELYLRRPPSANEEYRLDRMLKAAAERGVQVNVIVYKEVSQVLTLCSEHTKRALETHPNIRVFRHPDHAPSGQQIESDLVSAFKTLDLAKLPAEGLKSIYGASDDIILYWAHHEKLCLIDGKIAFMGGLDLCFGRWDTNSHPIADAHPTDISQSLFPGQDYNNARIYDFSDVGNWENNKLDRTTSSRMGWSDLSICISGPVVEDLRAHFVQRWNFIFNEKYDIPDLNYQPLSLTAQAIPDGYYNTNGSNIHAVEKQGKDGTPVQTADDTHRHHHLGEMGGVLYDQIRGNMPSFSQHPAGDQGQEKSGVSIQLVRSCTEWSNGVPLEHSIQNAYIEVIRNSQHFIYIENQFFITATGTKQDPIKNQVGAALVERVVRAYNSRQKFKVIVCMPCVPAFAGDLHADDSLGTRAIMEYQYQSICRGGHSIIEEIHKGGVPDASEYIRFYNLRNYDRINAGKAMQDIEDVSGVRFEDARKEHDDIVGAGYDGRGEETGVMYGKGGKEYDRYQEVAKGVQDSRFDSVSECYMDGGPSIVNIPFGGSEENEMDAFVSEELYIHSKILISDDRTVIVGSANLNDRSQLGSHDSEIAVIIEDPTPIPSIMNGQPYTVSAYASSFRRQIFRKHLGLLPFQDCTIPTPNFLPITKTPNTYDWNSPGDILVQDVLSHSFSKLWNGTASTNTTIFAKAFHPVPADNVTNWDEYEEFFGKLFVTPGEEGLPAKYRYGHVVKEEFPGGVRELKKWLSGVRGTLVDMPLKFMEGVEDFAKEGLKLNRFTDDVYT